MISHARQLQIRFISTLPIDEMFNKIKHKAASGSNSRISLEQAMAAAIDKKVMSGLNHFREVDRASAPYTRDVDDEDDTIHNAPLQKSKLSKPVAAMKLGSVVGVPVLIWRKHLPPP